MDDIVHASDGEDDDGVIFKGSPLYASLLQSGSLAEELEVEQTGVDTITANDISYKQSEEKKEKCDSNLACLKKTWKVIYKGILSWLLPDISPTYHNHHENVIKCLSESTCLEDDDQDFLHFYIKSSRDASNITAFSRISKLTLFTIPCLLSFSAYQFMDFDVAKHPFPWRPVLLTLITPIVVLVIFQEARVYKHKRKCKDKLFLYNGLIERSEKLATMVKKCLRLIQETELIFRGFTLVSQKNPLSRIEGGQKGNVARQCPVLRKLVFTVAREAVLLIREKTKKLFDMNPLCKELDIQGSYLAYEPIQSYGPCLQTDMEDMDTLQSVTDGFSVAALKGMTHLLSLHQSEFIKALVLVQQERFQKGMAFSSLEELSVVESLTESLVEWTVSLHKSHDYHSCGWMNREPVSKITKTQSSVDDIYIAVHSLDLHLQAALTRVKSLSDHIQNLPNSGGRDMNLDDLLDQMQPIKAELDSCKGCWEEGISRIEKSAGKDNQKAENGTTPAGIADSEETLSTDRGLKPIEDYIIEDQVFQGYTDPDEVLADYEWDKPLTAEEKEKKRKEKEEALRMLSELKKVISVRAVDTEKREKAAILKMYPDLKISEKLEDAEQSNQEESNTLSPQISSNQRPPIKSCDQSSEAPPSGQGIQNNNEKRTMLQQDTMGTCSSVVNYDDEVLSLDQELKGFERKCDDFHETHENCNDRDKHSVISSRGVRRLRKSDMLDLTDSDSEGYPEDNVKDEHYGDDDGDEENDCLPRLGLPLINFTKKVEFGEQNSGLSEDDTKFRLPVLSLEERLEHFSGANFGLTSELAEKAVAKSKTMGVMEETTFGGDVYGECSSSNDDDNDNDETGAEGLKEREFVCL